MSAIFLTGASGFVGREVLRALPGAGFTDVRCLTRRADTLRDSPGIRTVAGDLTEPASYAAALPAQGTVVHLAGAVGKRRPAEFQQHNVEGTRRLLRAAADAHVGHFVFVSSIAVTYGDLAQYPYGASKRDAEQAVREGPVAWTIVRPTMVFGPGSPNQASLERLALLPFPILFGTGRVRVQPIALDDLARVIVAAAKERWAGEVVEAGGPDVVTLDELFTRIRRAHGRSDVAPRHIPIAPVRRLLAMLEPVLWAALPFTAGQLSAFEHDSCAAPSRRLSALAPFQGLPRMLEIAQQGRGRVA